MNGRYGRSLAATVFAAFLIVTLADIARAVPAPVPAQAYLAGNAVSIRGDLSGAGMPGATLGTLTWGDYDHDGDQDFLLVVREGTTSRSRLYRNDGSDEYTGVATCTTVGNVTTCEGDASDGLSFIKTSSIELWVQNLTTDIAPADGVSGIEARTTAPNGGNGGAWSNGHAGTAGYSIAIHFIGGSHAIITQGREAHGIEIVGKGGNGGNGGAGALFDAGGDGGTGGRGSDIAVDNQGAITTHGALSHGISVQSLGGKGGEGGDWGGIVGHGGAGGTGGSGDTVSVWSSGNIATHGDSAIGILAVSTGGDGGHGGDAGGLVTGGGNGGAGGRGDFVTVANSGGITTEGIESHGILAQSLGGQSGTGGAGGGLVSWGGGSSASGAGGNVSITNSGSITTLGSGAIGVFGQSVGGFGGGGGGSGGLVSFGGIGKSGGNGGNIAISNSGTVLTQGNDAHAIFGQSVGGGGGSGAGSGGLVSLGGGGSAGGSGGDIAIANSGVLGTKGAFASGLFAQSIGGGGGNGGGSGGLVSIGGGGSATGDGGDVAITNSGRITTLGEFSQGIHAQSIGGGGGNGGGSGGLFSFGGAGAAGGHGDSVNVTHNGVIETSGDDANGVLAQSIGGGGGNGGGSGAVSAYVGVAVGGAGGPGGNGSAVLVTLGEGSISTLGERSNGVHAQSIGGGGGNGGFAFSAAVGKEFAASLAVGGGGGDGGKGGIVKVDSDADIATAGDRAHGIMAESIGGGGGTGGFALALSGAAGPAVSLAIGGSGGKGGSAGAVTVLSTGGIETSGYNAYGVFAQSVGGGGGNGGGSIAGSISGKAAVSAGFGGVGGDGGSGGLVDVTNAGRIETTGDESHGVFAQSVGGGGGSGGFVGQFAASTQNSLSLGFGGKGGKGGLGGAVEVSNAGAITTTGNHAYGILAQSVGGGGGSGGATFTLSGLTQKNSLDLSVGGSGGLGGHGTTVHVTNDGSILTTGAVSHGIFAQSVGGGGGDGGSNTSIALPKLPTGPTDPTALGVERGLNVSASAPGLSGGAADSMTLQLSVGIGGKGGAAGNGGAVTVENHGDIETTGGLSNGIFAQSVGGGGGSGGTNVDVELPSPGADPKESPSLDLSINVGVGGSGGAAGQGGAVSVGNEGDIQTHGGLSHGIFAQSVGGGGGSEIADVTNPLAGTSEVLSPSGIGINIGGSGGASGNGGAVSIANSGNIGTLGPMSHGIFAQSVGGGGGQGAEADMGLIGAFSLGGRAGASGNGGSILINNSGSIVTYGEVSHGIFAQSVGGGGGVGGDVKRGLGELNIGIGLGIGGDGTNAGNGGAISLTNSGDIATHGDNSIGIFAQSVGGGGGMGGGAGNFNLPVLFSFAGSSGGAGSGGSILVNQSGDISTDGMAAHGIFAQSAGGQTGAGDHGGAVSVTVAGDILVGGADAHGIIAQSVGSEGGGDITINVTSGTIQGGSGTGTGILFLDGADNTLDNHGTVTTLVGSDGAAIRGTGGNESIENYGTITGWVDLGGGMNTFHNFAGGVFESGSTVDLGASGTFTNDGVFAPGGSGVSTTTLTGDYVQTEAGLFEATVCGSEFDRLVVVDGTASLDGTLKIVADHDAYVDGTTYDIIEATDETGAFKEIVLPKTAFLDFTAEYLDNGVKLTVDVASFCDAAATPMQQKIAGVLDGCLTTASGDMSHMIGQFQLMNASQVEEGFYSLSPGSYDNLTRGSLQSVGLHQSELAQRMNEARTRPTAEWAEPTGRTYEGGKGWWLSGAYQGADQDPGDGFTEHNFATSAALAGYERADRSRILGASFGMTKSEVELGNDQANGTANGYLGSVYAGRLWGRTYGQTVLSFSSNSFENRRDINVGAEHRVATSEFDGTTFAGLIGSGTRVDAGRWGLEPFGTLRYARLNEDGFTEEGAGGVNLIAQNRTADWLGSELGLRVTTTFLKERSAWLPEFRLVWDHDFGLGDREAVVAFEAAPEMQFTVTGQQVEADGVTAGLGLSYQTVTGWKASVRYNHTQSGDFQANGFMIRLGSGF